MPALKTIQKKQHSKSVVVSAKDIRTKYVHSLPKPKIIKIITPFDAIKDVIKNTVDQETIRLLMKVLYRDVDITKTIKLEYIYKHKELEPYYEAQGTAGDLIKHIQNYKQIRPRCVKNSEKFSDKIDIAILRLLNCSRSDIAQLSHIVESPVQLAFHSPYKEMTDAERKHERHTQRTIMQHYNLERFLGKIDLDTLEKNMLRPFQKWTRDHFKHGTQDSVDVKAINQMTYNCLKKALQKDYYRPFFQDGYIWIVPTILDINWENDRGATSLTLMRKGGNPIEANGTPLEAHHVAGDYSTHKSWYAGYHPDTASQHSLKKRFLSECLILYITKTNHLAKGTHIWNCLPDRKLFGNARVNANKTQLYPYFQALQVSRT